MNTINEVFKNRVFINSKLEDYGFNKNENKYVFNTSFINNLFDVSIIIDEHDQYIEIIDNDFKEEYGIVYKYEKGNKAFHSELKKCIDSLLEDIKDKCSVYQVYMTRQAQMIIEYVKDKYNSELEFLWEKFPLDSIWRNKENEKWFGLLMVIDDLKLGGDKSKAVEVIDLRYNKSEKEKLFGINGVLPGYHMNKNSWFSVRLDNSVNDDLLKKFIDDSYLLSRDGK